MVCNDFFPISLPSSDVFLALLLARKKDLIIFDAFSENVTRCDLAILTNCKRKNGLRFFRYVDTILNISGIFLSDSESYRVLK